MTLITFSTAPTCASNGIRTWGKALSDALAAAGWIKTADTGQIDLTTVGTPSTTYQSMGYEIWRMNDALQATNPVFLKLEYGSGYAATVPCIWLTTGSGTNGDGTLTGQVSPRMQLNSLNTASTTAVGGFVSGSSSRIAACMWSGNASASSGSNTILFAIERTHDGSGSDTADGILIYTRSYSSVTASQYIPATGTIPAGFQAVNCTAPPTGTGANGTRVDTWPARCWGLGETSPFIGILAYFQVDLTALNPVSVSTWDGSSHTYIPLVVSGISYGGTCSTLMRYD